MIRKSTCHVSLCLEETQDSGAGHNDYNFLFPEVTSPDPSHNIEMCLEQNDEHCSRGESHHCARGSQHKVVTS